MSYHFIFIHPNQVFVLGVKDGTKQTAFAVALNIENNSKCHSSVATNAPTQSNKTYIKSFFF